MFLNEFNSIKVRKILQILKTLRINIQLFSSNQFNKNVFKLMIVNLHLIVNTNLALIFLKKKQKFVIYFAFLFLYFFRIFFIKRNLIAINI